MKKLFLATIIIFCSQHSFSQTKDVSVNNNETTPKFFVSASGGLLTVNKEKDYGYNFDLGVGYQLSNKINLILEGMHGQAKNKETSFLYDVNKYSVLAEISNKEKDSFFISSLVGFSAVKYATNTCLNGGLDLGVQANFCITKKIIIGAKVIEDFNTNPIDRFTQVNAFVRLKI